MMTMMIWSSFDASKFPYPSCHHLNLSVPLEDKNTHNAVTNTKYAPIALGGFIFCWIFQGVERDTTPVMNRCDD